MSQWIDICQAEELAPGQRRLVDMGDDDEVLVLNIAGKYYAINNACPHAGAALERGTVMGSVLVCPLHRWGFCLSTGQSLQDDNLYARTYGVVSTGERLYLVLD